MATEMNETEIKEAIAQGIAAAMLHQPPLPPQQYHAPPLPLPPKDAITIGAIVKWVAGIFASLVTLGIASAVAYSLNVDSAQNEDIKLVLDLAKQNSSNFENYKALEVLKQEALQKQFDRIEANTKDRITRTETLREINDITADLKKLEAFALESRQKLIDRGTFMTTTEARLNALERTLK